MIPHYVHKRSVVALTTLLLTLVLVLPASAKLQVLTTPVQLASAATPQNTYPFTHTVRSLGNAFTVRSVATVNGEPLLDGANDVLWLAGVGPEAGSAPSSLALTWEPEASSWFGTSWTLRLRSEAGLLPLQPLDSQNDANNGSVINLHKANPESGHQYETLFSYNRITGALSLRLTDVTSDNTIYQGAFNVGRPTGSLFASAGAKRVFAATDNYQYQVRTLEEHPLYLPVGLKWDTGHYLDSIFISATQFDFNEDVNVRVSALGSSLPGLIRLQTAAEKTTTELGQATISSTDVNVTLPTTSLPPGMQSIYLEYQENGTALLRDSRGITVGVARFEFGKIDIDSKQGQLSSQVTISSFRTMAAADINIRAQIEELKWNEKKRNYDAVPIKSATLVNGKFNITNQAPTEIQLQLPIPTQPGYFRVSFEPVITPDVKVIDTQTEQQFSTYAPAVLQPGEPYVIAVLPDTQYYSKSYPHIFTRQTQWIAEQAADRNIVLTLQLGDITDNNQPDQWANSLRSMQFLNGVMPYVIAQGNHDLRNDGSVESRDYSRINTYFPLKNQPWITGTFAAGRIENSYSLFTFQGQNYLILSLEFGPRNEVLAWASKIVANYPNHKVIMITHSYTSHTGGRSNSALGYGLANNPNTTANGGPGMWSNLVQNHANFQLVLSGHAYATTIPRQVALGVNRNIVYEMLMDYQGDPNGGNGYLVLFTFNPNGNIEVKAYSPYLGQDRNQRDERGYDNHFIINTKLGRFEKP